MAELRAIARQKVGSSAPAWGEGARLPDRAALALRPARRHRSRQHLAAWLERWAVKYPKLTTWVEAQIEETFTFYRLPQMHHKHLKSTNLLERFHQELKRRSLEKVVAAAIVCLGIARRCGKDSFRELKS